MSVAGAVTNAGSDGKTLLHCAAMSGQTSVIAELLAAGANPHARCSSGETPLDLAGRWLDHNANLPAAPGQSSGSSEIVFEDSPAPIVGGGGGGGGSGSGDPSLVYQGAPTDHPAWNEQAIAAIYHKNNTPAGPVHSPGWPSPRGAGGGFMQVPSPATPTNVHAASAATAAAAAFASPPPAPTPPAPPLRSHVKEDAAGVAWLGVAQTTAGGTTVEGQAGGEAVAGGAATAVANSAFYGQENSPSPATKGRLWAERIEAGRNQPLCRVEYASYCAMKTPRGPQTAVYVGCRKKYMVDTQFLVV
ncbi:conserved unknown protein [Ectocarpus siliculosus]|uniref:Uncharacterized protein n=1 Tax=Ectocarpus siliculosus TaxID=2880 RepID=D7FJV3_ECTSI|nr:conserved unknown protein [Ectocarpus siliculosus]|eukprot:CBJ29201.1 conserved unknown protein [Ectocarpus siliculosus]